MKEKQEPTFTVHWRMFMNTCHCSKPGLHLMKHQMLFSLQQMVNFKWTEFANHIPFCLVCNIWWLKAHPKVDEKRPWQVSKIKPREHAVNFKILNMRLYIFALVTNMKISLSLSLKGNQTQEAVTRPYNTKFVTCLIILRLQIKQRRTSLVSHSGNS